MFLSLFHFFFQEPEAEEFVQMHVSNVFGCCIIKCFFLAKASPYDTDIFRMIWTFFLKFSNFSRPKNFFCEKYFFLTFFCLFWKIQNILFLGQNKKEKFQCYEKYSRKNKKKVSSADLALITEENVVEKFNQFSQN